MASIQQRRVRRRLAEIALRVEATVHQCDCTEDSIDHEGRCQLDARYSAERDGKLVYLCGNCTLSSDKHVRSLEDGVEMEARQPRGHALTEGLSAAQQQGARYANQIIDAMHASACRVSTKSDPNGSFGPAVECRSCEESVGLDEPDDVIKRFIADHRDCTGVAGFNESASANVTYFDRLKVCRSLLTELADALDKHSAKQKASYQSTQNWGFAGDLGGVEQALRDILATVRSGYNT